MTLSINQELCNGCGACIEACPENAILLMAGKAKIDESLCTSCETCVSLCPVDAIQRETVSTPTVYIPSSSGVSSRDIQISKPAVVQVPMPGPKPVSLLERLGVALFALGREVLPYLVDGLTNKLEQRVASPRERAATISAQPVVRGGVSRVGRGSHQRKRRRGRGGRV